MLSAIARDMQQTDSYLEIKHSNRLFLLAKGVRVIHCVGEKGAVGVVPVSCCAVNCTIRFKRDSGIGFYAIPAKQVRREAWLRAISRAGWEAKSSDRHCGEHFVSGRPSWDPKNVDHVPTLFKDGKRRANCSVPDRERKERSAKRAKVRENEEDVLTAAGLLNMASSCEDALRDASSQTDHAFPMLDPKYLVSPNPELPRVGCLAGRAGVLETFTAKISTSANGKQQPKD